MTSSPATGGQRLDGIDGLRAFAVLAVIAAHAHVFWLPGGGVGVDIFFGISGFLITYLLLREADRFGRISLGKFWLRRVLRLYPALLILVVVVDALAVLVVHFKPNADFGNALQATPSVLFYFANWMIVATQSAFLGPFGPLWSLSVEEQFYLGWPLLVLLAIRCRRPKTLLASIAVIAILAANVYRFASFRAGDLYQTFGTEFRADMILAGVLLALVMHGGGASIIRRVSPFLAVPGVVYLAVVAIVVPRFGQPDSRPAEQLYYTWGFPLVALFTVSVIAFLVTHPGSGAVKALTIRPLDYSGRISYGLYLWHYPVMFFIGSAIDLNPNLLLLAGLAGTYGIAALSWRFVEQPLQRRFHARLRPSADRARLEPFAAQPSRPA